MILFVLLFTIIGCEFSTKPIISTEINYAAWNTNEKYKNDDVIWSRPKGLLYGNFVGAQPAQKANLYPDMYSTYFVSNIRMEPEWKLMIKGQYPHSRYFSFTVAKELGEGQIGGGSFLKNDQILPDPGSLNPFSPGNNRSVTNRNYTIYFVYGDLLDKNDSNTLYTGLSDKSQRSHLSIRIYLQDLGYDGSGVCKIKEDCLGLPIVTLLFKNGTNITGIELLTLLNATKNGDPNGYDLNQWLEEVNNKTDKINSPCTGKSYSQVFWNTAYSVSGSFEAFNPEKRVRDYPPSTEGGFANNPDTKYMLIFVSFGINEILVVRGKKPSHPTTLFGDVFLPENPQVQYFSVSTAGSPPSGEGWDTIFDEQIPTDSNGDYTVVISWPWNRPANAILENGVVWINSGNGEGHYIGSRNWVTLLYLRFQGNDPNWKHSPANIPMPSTSNPFEMDEEVMGPYFPRSTYMSKDYFEKTYFKN